MPGARRLPHNGAMTQPLAHVDDLQTPVVCCDTAGVILHANPAFARWLQVGQRRLQNQPVSALETQARRLADALASFQPEMPPVKLHRVAWAMPGLPLTRFADVLIAHTPDGFLIEAHPVDEFSTATSGEALSAAIAAAMKGLAHELRNPLAGIRGATQLLARKRDEAQHEEITRLIQSEVDRLTQMLDRLISPHAETPHTLLNFHAILDRVQRLAENDAGWAVKINRDFDPSLPDIEGDADRLTQAVWNLVRNAIEAGSARVILRTRAEHGVRIGDVPHALCFRLDIVDDGNGVPGSLAEQVFLPLVTGRAEGSGLGLALAQQVAREHGGTVSYKSRPGHTVFTLTLPYRDAGDADV